MEKRQRRAESAPPIEAVVEIVNGRGTCPVCRKRVQVNKTTGLFRRHFRDGGECPGGANVRIEFVPGRKGEIVPPRAAMSREERREVRDEWNARPVTRTRGGSVRVEYTPPPGSGKRR